MGFFNYKKVCRDCGYYGEPKQNINPLIRLCWHLPLGLCLLACGIVPGLLYFGWLNSRDYAKCRKCGSRSLIPPNSPVGRKIRGES